MVPGIDDDETPDMRPGSDICRRWVSAAIAIAMASRMLLPLHDGVLVSVGGQLVPVCSASGLRFVPTPDAGAPSKQSQHRFGDPAACVHGLAAISCLQDGQGPHCLSAGPVRPTPAFGPAQGRGPEFALRDTRSRDPPAKRTLFFRALQ